MSYSRAFFYNLLIFLISPVLGLLVSLVQKEKKLAMNLFWGFIIFYGFNFVIYDDLMDANRYAEDFFSLHQEKLSFNSFLDNVFLNEESSFLDIGMPLLHFVLAIFTGKSSILFGVYALIFGFFYTRNIWYVGSKVQSELNFYLVLFFSVLLLLIPFWSINGFRFWTAFQIFIYATLPILFDEKLSKRPWFMALAVLFHFSFIVPVALILFRSFLPQNLTLLYILYLISFFISEVSLQPIQEILVQVSPEMFHKKLISYTNESYREKLEFIDSQSKWFVSMRTQGMTYLTFFILTLIFFKYRERIFENSQIKKRLILIFQMLVIFGFFSIIPSMGRFMNISYFFLFTFLIWIWPSAHSKEQYEWFKFSVWLCLPLIFLFLVFQIRIGTQSINSLVLFGNPFMSFFSEGESLLNFLKN